MTANILPLAALMVFGGRLGDLFGMRRVFLVGAVVFALATTAMGASQNIDLGDRRPRPAGGRRGADDADRAGDRQRRLPGRAEGLGARDPGRRLGLLRRPRAGARRGADLDRLAPRLPRQRAAGGDRDHHHPAGDARPEARPGRLAGPRPAGRRHLRGGGRRASIFGLSQGPEEGWGQARDAGPDRRRARRDPGLPPGRAAGGEPDDRLQALPPRELPRLQRQPAAGRDGRARARLPDPVLPPPRGRRLAGRRRGRADPGDDPGDPRRPARRARRSTASAAAGRWSSASSSSPPPASSSPSRSPASRRWR